MAPCIFLVYFLPYIRATKKPPIPCHYPTPYNGLTTGDHQKHSHDFLGVLQDVSARGDTESREGLAEVISEVTLALARRSTDWIASASELEHFNNRNAERAEATFSQYSVQLRTKVRPQHARFCVGTSYSLEDVSFRTRPRPGRGYIMCGSATVCAALTEVF